MRATVAGSRKARFDATKAPLFACLMAGGSGTRFWPASRERRPKQLIRLSGEKTLLQDTYDRVRPLVPPERIVVVTAASQARQVARQLPELPSENLVAEPVGRNTAACAGLAAVWAQARHPGGILALFPSDHIIADGARWRRVLTGAWHHAMAHDGVVTCGLVPTRPETGFGYIRVAERIAGGPDDELFRVEAFVEKPALGRAVEFVESGKYLWNSGVFIVRASRLLDLMRSHLPDLAAGLVRISGAATPAAFRRAVSRYYPSLPSISLDQGVMEKAGGLAVVRADVGWSDVGSWAALADVVLADPDGNVALGRSLSVDSSGCVTYSSGRLIATLGVRDLVVVETGDAILVCPRDRCQDVRKVVEKLRASGRTDLL